MKSRRPLMLVLLMLLFVIGIPTGLALREYHHIQVDRALIAAVETDDTKTALAALNAGGEADYPHKYNSPRPALLQWLDRMFGFHAPLHEEGPSLLAQSVQNNNTVLVKSLLDRGATDVQGSIKSLNDRDGPEDPISLLAVAAEAGNLEICQALLKHGADVDCGGFGYALRMAPKHGHSEVIRFLFQHGATLDTSDELDDNSLMAAAQSGSLESVRLLLAHGADAKYEGRFDSALTVAVHGGNLAVVKLVTEAGADVNGGGAYTYVLQDAAEVGDVDIVRYLLKKGAKVNVHCRWNHTPLLNAVKGEHIAVIKLLLALSPVLRWLHHYLWRRRAGQPLKIYLECYPLTDFPMDTGYPELTPVPGRRVLKRRHFHIDGGVATLVAFDDPSQAQYREHLLVYVPASTTVYSVIEDSEPADADRLDREVQEVIASFHTEKVPVSITDLEVMATADSVLSDDYMVARSPWKKVFPHAFAFIYVERPTYHDQETAVLKLNVRESMGEYSNTYTMKRKQGKWSILMQEVQAE